MKQTTKRFLSMILGVVFFVGSIVIFFEFIKPAYGETLKLRGEKDSIQKFFDDEKKTVSTVKELIKNYTAKEVRIQETASLILPMEPDIAGAVAQLYGLSQNNNLQLQSISMSVAGLANAAPVAGLNPSNLSSALERPIGTLSISTSLTGSYEDFKTFLSQLQLNIRIFDVKSLTVSPIVKPAAKDKLKNSREIGEYNFAISVSAYYQGQ